LGGFPVPPLLPVLLIGRLLFRLLRTDPNTGLPFQRVLRLQGPTASCPSYQTLLSTATSWGKICVDPTLFFSNQCIDPTTLRLGVTNATTHTFFEPARPSAVRFRVFSLVVVAIVVQFSIRWSAPSFSGMVMRDRDSSFSGDANLSKLHSCFYILIDESEILTLLPGRPPLVVTCTFKLPSKAVSSNAQITALLNV
jgi:hypothetical protein